MTQMKDDENVRITESDLPQEFIVKLLGQHEARGLWGIKHTRDPVDLMVNYAKTRELSLPIVQVVVTREGIFVSPISGRNNHAPVRRVVGVERQQSERCWTRSGIPRTWISPNTLSTFLSRRDNGRSESDGRRQVTDVGVRGSAASKFIFGSSKKKDGGDDARPTTDLTLLERFSRHDWRKTGVFFFGIDTISYGVQDLIFTRVFSMIVVLDRQARAAAGANSSFMCHAFVCESRSTARRLTYALAAAFQAYGKSMKSLKINLNPQRSIRSDRPRKFTIDLLPPSEIACDYSEA